MSIAYVELQQLATSYVIGAMQTIDETRRQKLAILVGQHGNSLAKLNEALGMDRTDATLSQIRTQAPHSKTGKRRVMGDDLARKIEDRLGLERGWMDTPPSLSEQYGQSDPRTLALQVFESLPPEEWATALRLLGALAKPTPNGTHG